MTFNRALGLVLVLSSLLAGCSSGSPGVLIGPDAFGFLPDGSGSYERVLVSGDFHIPTAVAALERAGARFSLVTEDGTEHPTDESLLAADLYSPSYVADPKVRSDGIELYVDCKGVIEPPMAATLRRILREELAAAGVVDADVKPITD